MDGSLGFARLLDIHDFRDAEGRPLGEHRATRSVRDACQTILKQCPYADSRFQHHQPMNTSALKQLTSRWDDILAGVSFIRQQHLQRRGLAAVQQTRDCVAIGEAVAAIPSFLIFRADSAVVDGAIDPLVAGLYKVIIGVNRVYSLLLSGEVMGGAPTMASPEDVAEFADLGGFLIGAEQVCAGSARQISQTIEAIVNGHAPAAGSVLEQWLAPLDRFFAFADGMRRLEAVRFLVKAAATIALREMSACLGESSPELRTTIATLIATLDPPGSIENFATTRTPAQIDRLLAGWFELAGGAPAVGFRRPPGATDWAVRFAPTLDRIPDRARLALGEHLYTLLHLENTVVALVEDIERQLDAALERSSMRAPLDPRQISRGFGVTALDRMSAELGVALTPLS